MMTPARFNAVCKGFPRATYVCQWGGSHVGKIGAKVFAIGSPEAGGAFHVTFKVSSMAFEILKTEAGCRPAPYLASRGMLWIQWTGPGILDEAGLRDQLRDSYHLVAAGLTRTLRRELGFESAAAPATTAGNQRERATDTARAASKRKSAGAKRAPSARR